MSWVDSCSTNYINELNKGQLDLHPNPASDIIHIENIDANSKYSIYASNGKLMCTGRTDGPINVSQLQKGIYFIEISGENPKNIKFSKQ